MHSINYMGWVVCIEVCATDYKMKIMKYNVFKTAQAFTPVLGVGMILIHLHLKKWQSCRISKKVLQQIENMNSSYKHNEAIL